MKLRITLAGATGWAGSALARGIAESPDLILVSAVSRKASGTNLGNVIGMPSLECPVSGSVEAALQIPSDIFFEYTKPEFAKQHVLLALKLGRHVIVGTSGLTDEDYEEIDAAAKQAKRGVLAVGNFALTVVLLQKFAEMAARYIPQWEIIDYASDAKIDVPSGTTRELAKRLADVRTPSMTVPLNQVIGPKESRGATVKGTQIHSVRLPGYTLGAEVTFGMRDQRLSIRHEAGSSAEPYVDGAILAIQKVNSFVGLRRGLDTVMGL